MVAFGSMFAQLYGQGEAPMTIIGLRRADHVGPDDAVLGFGRLGALRGSTSWCCGADDRPRRAGEIGEILCRATLRMSGYWENPGVRPRTPSNRLAAHRRHRSSTTRFLTLKDRSEGCRISGGSNIYPREVEEVLLEHPGVSEACVVG